MPVSEEQRRELFDRLRSILDERTATLLLEVTMPANVELATRADVQELRAEMLLHFTELAGRMTELDGRVTGRIAEVTGRIAELEKVLTIKLYTRVIPAIGIMIALAAWLG